MRLIPVYQPDLSGNERKYVLECLDSTWISSKGRFIADFEGGFASFVGAPHAVSVCNGTVALHLALVAFGIGPGDEVIVPSLTYIASVNASGHLATDSTRATEAWSLPDILDHHPRFWSAKLLKIDTDGFDTLIVKGAVDILRATHPVVYLEYDLHFFLAPDPTGFDVFEFLRVNGYVTALFFRNTGKFLTEARLEDIETLRHLHAACIGQSGKRYFDVCAFHDDDVDVCVEIRDAETALHYR